MSYRILSVRDLGEYSFDWLIPDVYLNAKQNAIWKKIVCCLVLVLVCSSRKWIVKMWWVQVKAHWFSHWSSVIQNVHSKIVQCLNQFCSWLLVPQFGFESLSSFITIFVHFVCAMFKSEENCFQFNCQVFNYSIIIFRNNIYTFSTELIIRPTLRTNHFVDHSIILTFQLNVKE